MKNVDWTVAKGSCGLNIGDRLVHAAYVNGVGLFAFEGHPGRVYGPSNVNGILPSYNCIVTGHCITSGHTMDNAKDNGVYFASRYGNEGADAVLTAPKFRKLINDPTRLGECFDE